MPFYRMQADGARYGNLDGVRALCALAVVLTHAKAFYNLNTGKGFFLAGGIDAHLSLWASFGVNLFFQITGFLFWDKVLSQSGALDIRRHLSSRIRRLVPLYIFFGLAALAAAMARHGVSPPPGTGDLVRAAAGTFSFGVVEATSFGGDFHFKTTTGITWTLAYEWCFYLALPLLALMVRRRMLVIAAIGYGLYQLAFPTKWLIANFVAGMLVAWLVRNQALRTVSEKTWAMALPILALAALAAMLVYHVPVIETVALAGLLYFAVNTSHLDPLLQQPGLAFIGRISYSVYLLHCTLLYQFFWVLRRHGALDNLDTVQQWLLFSLGGFAVVIVSAVTYRYIEHPFIRPGRPRANGLGRHQPVD